MGFMRIENSFPCEWWLIGKNTLTRRRGYVQHFSRYHHCAKAIRDAELSGCRDWTRETDAYRVLRKSFRRWNRKPWLSGLDLEYLPPSAAHSVRWSESVLFLPAPYQFFKMNLSQLTSLASIQRNYDWEYASTDIVPRTSAVRPVHYNLQPKWISADSTFV